MSTARPSLVRQDSELLMSYYQSPLADQGIGHSPTTPGTSKRPVHRRSFSGNSTSSSDYSSGADSDDRSFTEDVKPATRRASIPSKGGADRRRLAIVQMNTVREGADPPSGDITTNPATVRSRRGLETRLDGLALIAPPDAALKSYAYLTPPTSAPPTAVRAMHLQIEDKSHHTRSASEASTSASRHTKSKPSRDIGIVGTAVKPPEPPKQSRLHATPDSLVPPVFQEPHASRAPSPNVLATPQSHPQPKRRSTDLSIHTPEIGQAKEIHVPVASPVIVELGPDASRRVGNSSFDHRSPALHVVEPRSAPLSSYLHYQPGVHATAGPLPPPPRATFSIGTSTPPPPRPPRLHSPPPRAHRGDLDVVSQALQLPMTSSRSNTPTSTSRSISPAQLIDPASSGSGDDSSNDEAQHRREGAFSPSTISTTPSTSPSDYSPTTAHPGRTIDGLLPSLSDGSKSPSSVSSSAVASPIVIPAPPRLESLPEHAAESWTYVSRDLTASPSSDGHVSQDRVSWESYSPRRSQEGNTGGQGFKASLTSNLKRFSSLPRTPSPSSKSLTRSSSTRSPGRTPSVSPSVKPVALPSGASPPIQMPRRRKIIAQYPAALFCADIASRKSAAERCSMYARKINELYTYDCGLGDWVLDARFKAANGSRKRATLTQSIPSFVPQPRHVSRSSMKSEATFPTRPDAMVATDLSTKPSDNAPAVPTLPYPALSPRTLGVPLPPPSMRMLAASPPSSKTGNFFASLGRKASISRKDRPTMGFPTTTTTTRLVKSPPMSLNPRPVVIANTPSVPGGPRAPPNRAIRAQSIAPPPSPFASNASDRILRRPSLFTPPSSSSSSEARTSGAPADRDFERQVDKLADLLPQAERTVLAGYLRRAGQDILAIGQFLEDEKNGVLRRG
ncbi:hypothetical protein B0H15DRAFT_774997 [Mycena belliarum]|uniref:Uncharacterized protein n=1 Tax=Mycena belliarum TaxID=1033014 RepID=A0AAD6U9A6_9AGAR|nr:hypothetical protein B0H15DRAFT_774997 [Mycena belliae]